jgi:transposase-like protein
MLSIHPQARTTPAVRQEIARSSEPTGVLAQRFGVSTETVRKWRKRGAQDCQDHSSRPHKLPWKATEEERVIAGYEVDCDDHQQGSGGERTGERHAGSG